jgi:hypothetical protein
MDAIFQRGFAPEKIDDKSWERRRHISLQLA